MIPNPSFDSISSWLIETLLCFRSLSNSGGLISTWVKFDNLKLKLKYASEIATRFLFEWFLFKNFVGLDCKLIGGSFYLGAWIKKVFTWLAADFLTLSFLQLLKFWLQSI